jgi:hypothetical protein
MVLLQRIAPDVPSQSTSSKTMVIPVRAKRGRHQGIVFVASVAVMSQFHETLLVQLRDFLDYNDYLSS